MSSPLKRHPNFNYGSIYFDRRLSRWRFSWSENGMRCEKYFDTRDECEVYRKKLYPDYTGVRKETFYTRMKQLH